MWGSALNLDREVESESRKSGLGVFGLLGRISKSLTSQGEDDTNELNKCPHTIEQPSFSKNYSFKSQDVIDDYEREYRRAQDDRSWAGKVLSGTKKKINNATGQTDHEKADRIHNRLKRESENAEERYEKFSKDIEHSIKSSLDVINVCKGKLATRAFPRFIEVTSCINHWEVGNIDFFETFQYDRKAKHKVAGRGDIFKSDFDNDKLKTAIKATLTLGIWTRKQSKQALSDLKNIEVPKFKNSLSIKDAEVTRLMLLVESTKQVAEIFETLYISYEHLLKELSYALQSVKASQFLAQADYFNEKIDCYFLPPRHLSCLMLLDKMTRILFKISKQNIFSDEILDEKLHEEKKSPKEHQKIIDAHEGIIVAQQDFESIQVKKTDAAIVA